MNRLIARVRNLPSETKALLLAGALMWALLIVQLTILIRSLLAH